ncbi:MAG: Jag N-terminal domain-containing protein, partial [Clostridia bacterium]|nr:Jag N-terminal domain-containing protein [Clostridia bacterium]
MSNTETYIVSAKTVDEAMAIAQQKYGGAGRDISFDILEMPRKGFLGIGAKDAKIKVTVTEEEEISLGSIVAEMKSYRMQTDRDGQADKPKQEKPAQPKQERPAQPKQEKSAQPKQERPAQPKQERPAQPKQEIPAQPKQERPAQPKQEKPAQPKQE